MKTFQITLSILFLGSLNFVLASESIDTQIMQINEAPTQEKVKLMNEFKLKLSTLSEQEREEAITKLQMKTQMKTQTNEKSQSNQATQMENMKKGQEMNQHKILNQVIQRGNIGSNTQNFKGKK